MLLKYTNGFSYLLNVLILALTIDFTRLTLFYGGSIDFIHTVRL